MAQKPTIIAFDADDTLWHNERFFKISQERFADLLRPYTDPDHLSDRLLAACWPPSDAISGITDTGSKALCCR